MSFAVKVDTQFNDREFKIKGRRVVGKTMYEVGLVVQSQAKTLCPVKLGRLRGSITTQSKTQGTDVVGKALSDDKIPKPTSDMEVHVGSNVYYALYVEMGTRYMNAQPYLRPALALAKGETLNILVKNGKAEFTDFA